MTHQSMTEVELRRVSSKDGDMYDRHICCSGMIHMDVAAYRSQIRGCGCTLVYY